MSSFVVEGGHKLRGEITPQGAKNEALQIISAVLLTSEEVTISNIPEILDIKNLILLLEGMGVCFSGPSQCYPCHGDPVQGKCSDPSEDVREPPVLCR